MGVTFDQLRTVVQAAIANAEGVKVALSPADLGMRAGKGTIIVVSDDGSQMRLEFRDATPANEEETEESKPKK
jgi:hypothetical protein